MTYSNRRNTFTAILMTLLTATLSGRAVMAREKHKPVEKETPGTSPVSVSVSNSDYKDLVYRNLFSKDQRKRRSDSRDGPIDHETANELARSREKAKESENKGEIDVVLMGIVERDGVASAFLEDRHAGKTITAKSGDMIGAGRVGKISVNALEYVVGSRSANIMFGSNLQGGVSSVRPLDITVIGAGPSTDGKGAGDAKGGAGATDDPNAAIIEKLRRKRLKELNR